MGTEKDTKEVTTPQPADAVAEKQKLKELEYDGFKFSINEELLDDVELLEMIDAIENDQKPALIITLLKKLIGDDGYDVMKAYFVEKDGRFKMTKLGEIYKVIFEDFDPKG